MAVEIISRKDAKAQGFTYYFTGKQCPGGHVTRRYVSTYGCFECARLNTEKWNSTGRFSQSKEVVPSARSIARVRGFIRYYTGQPCKHGHVCERYVAKAVCVECDGARRKTDDGARKRREQARIYTARFAEKARKKPKSGARQIRKGIGNLSWRGESRIRRGFAKIASSIIISAVLVRMQRLECLINRIWLKY
jgi:hypothetical protein